MNRIDRALNDFKCSFANGDETIDIIGFSRGAALALHFANKIHEEKAGAKIRFLGLWDVVRSFGPVTEAFNHFDLTLADHVEMCCHAMALDERRLVFPVTRVVPGEQAKRSTEGRLEEMWFRGVHSDVGGGCECDEGLSSIALDWMFERAKQCGLPIAASAFEDHENLQNPGAKITPNTFAGIRSFDLRTREFEHNDLVHKSVQPRGNVDGIEHNDPPPLAIGEVLSESFYGILRNKKNGEYRTETHFSDIENIPECLFKMVKLLRIDTLMAKNV